VDDDPAVVEALTAALKGTYVVHGAATGTEACAILRANPVAVIILDAVLGEEHGLDRVERFRSLSPARILILTGHSSEELAIRAVWANVDGYLKKPVSVPDLHRALARLIPDGEWPAKLAARAQRYLDEHATKPFSTADLARQLGVSEAHLRRCFRAAYGKTPRRYAAEVQIMRGAVLLRATSQPIEKIALDLGYSSSTMFGKAFRRLLGVSPSEYRTGRRTEESGG
jgi:YesN/AraC family two-component response regulator